MSRALRSKMGEMKIATGSTWSMVNAEAVGDLAATVERTLSGANSHEERRQRSCVTTLINAALYSYSLTRRAYFGDEPDIRAQYSSRQGPWGLLERERGEVFATIENRSSQWDPKNERCLLVVRSEYEGTVETTEVPLWRTPEKHDPDFRRAIDAFFERVFDVIDQYFESKSR